MCPVVYPNLAANSTLAALDHLTISQIDTDVVAAAVRAIAFSMKYQQIARLCYVHAMWCSPMRSCPVAQCFSAANSALRNIRSASPKHFGGEEGARWRMRRCSNVRIEGMVNNRATEPGPHRDESIMRIVDLDRTVRKLLACKSTGLCNDWLTAVCTLLSGFRKPLRRQHYGSECAMHRYPPDVR